MPDGSLHATTGLVDITPTIPIPLGASRDPRRPFIKIDTPLEANVFIARCGGHEVTFVSVDLLFPGERLRRNLLASIPWADGQTLVLGATHTHFAPMVQEGMPNLGTVDSEFLKLISDRIAELILRLRQELRPAAIRYSEGMANHSMNRRLMRWRVNKRGRIEHCEGYAPNPAGPRDESMRMVEVVADGSTMGLVWNYACHPTAYPNQFHVSAEFPGVVRSRLRAELGPIPVLYFQGFSGDVRPRLLGRLKTPQEFILRVLQGPLFGKPSLAEWEAWASSLADEVLKMYKSERTVLNVDEIRFANAAFPVADIAPGHNPNDLFELQYVELKNGFRFVGWNAELVHGYRKMIARILGEERLFTAGCLDQTLAYIPLEEMLPGRGYEVEGFHHNFAFSGKYAPGMKSRMEQAIRELHRRIER
jgi:hypothetical protein